MFAGTTDSTVADNVWVGGDAQWRPQKAYENAGLILRGNGNGGPVVDPNGPLKARIAAIDAELLGLVATFAGLQTRQQALNAERAELIVRLI